MSASAQLILYILVLIAYVSHVYGKTYNILDYGVIPSNSHISACNTNTKIITDLLNTQLQSGDTLKIPTGVELWFNGGIYISEKNNITLEIDGSINYQSDRKYWPTQNNSDKVLEAMRFDNSHHITFTSSRKVHKGLINGNGKKWWGALQYCINRENRPRLLHMHNSTDIVIEYIYFKDSPFWNVYLEDVKNVEIHHSNISARRDNKDYHDLLDITAFNTDGFDVSGENVWIHDVEIWNDDDCIAVKAQSTSSFQSNCSRNMLFENINASGVGLTIGSIAARQHRCVDNITFRNVYMYHTWKGIYLKSAPGSGKGSISNILYDNITMEGPTGVPIWIGPQQAIYENQCSLLWPSVPFTKCPVNAGVTWTNITLRNVFINSPKQSPGVILGNETNPMRNIVFDNVVVKNPGKRPWGDQYYDCEGVRNFESKGGTYPVPQCKEAAAVPWVNKSRIEGWVEDIPGYEEFEELMECLVDEDDREIEVYEEENIRLEHIGAHKLDMNETFVVSFWVIWICSIFLGMSIVFGWKHRKKMHSANSATLLRVQL